MNGWNGGFLNNRLNYILAKKKKAQQYDKNNKASKCTDVMSHSANEKNNVDGTNDNKRSISMEDIHSMKTIIICKKTMDLMEEMLNKTRSYRLRLHKKNDVELKEYFPYFFSHPTQMVLNVIIYSLIHILLQHFYFRFH